MNAILKIYKDCTSDEPSKVYTCKRLLFGVSKKALSISETMQGKTELEQIDSLVELIQLIFPDFEDEEINYVDALELGNFINEVVNATNAEMRKSQKK